MPIRSPRGRAAAYRAVWGWPLRTPLRLALVVAVIVVVAVLLSLGFGALRPAVAPSQAAQPTVILPPTATRTPASAVPTALPPVAALTPTTLPVSAAPPEALQAAQGFAAAWANHPAGTTNPQWVAGLTPYTTPEYVGTLNSVDPGNIPASRVTGPATATSVAAALVVARVPTDSLTLSITVVQTAAGWRVSGYDRV